MDPLTAATSFATVIGLLCNFRQERGAAETATDADFLTWLEKHNHQDIKKLIEQNAALQTGIAKLLRADHKVMLEKLDSISGLLATLLSRVPDFRDVAVTMVPKAELSDQAVSILRQLAQSNSAFFFSMKWIGGFQLQLEQGGRIEFSDQRFLNDDLDQLVHNGLLSLTYSGDGKNEIYGITRNGARLIAAIDGK